jgi:hypothetical protein
MKPAFGIGATLIALTGLALVAVPARAQDSNYWSTAYGTRSTLLGGVVVGSPGDISAVFYNPGALALAPNTEFLLSGSAFQYTRVNVTNGAGPSRDLVSSTLGTVPSLLAGEIPILKHDRLAYSYLTRQQVELDMEKNLTTGPDASSPLPNATFAAYELQYHQHVSEGWYGLTWSHALSPTLGFGVTPALAVRSQRTIASLMAMGENAAGQQAVLRVSRDFDYMHYRLLARLGLNGVRDSLTYGVTLTTPGLGVAGGGNYRQSLNLTDQTGTVGNVIGASYQEGLKAEYHSPVGVGFGASYGFGGTRLHFTGEWWAAVDRYTVIDAAPFTVRVPITVQNPSGDSTVTATVSDQMNSVFNWGVGFEHHFTPDVSGFASYHTDQTGRPSDSPPNASVTAWDLNHVTAGVSFNAWRSNFALGLSTAFGSRPIKSFALRPDRVPPSDLETHALMVTGSLGWKISF